MKSSRLLGVVLLLLPKIPYLVRSPISWVLRSSRSKHLAVTPFPESTALRLLLDISVEIWGNVVGGKLRKQCREARRALKRSSLYNMCDSVITRLWAETYRTDLNSDGACLAHPTSVQDTVRMTVFGIAAAGPRLKSTATPWDTFEKIFEKT